MSKSVVFFYSHFYQNLYYNILFSVGLEDLNSDTDTDDEDNPKKQIPKWATGGQLRTALLKQCYMGPDPEQIFFMKGETPDLSVMFTHQRKR